MTTQQRPTKNCGIRIMPHEMFVYEQWNQRKTNAEMADHFGVAQSTVSNFVCKHKDLWLKRRAGAAPRPTKIILRRSGDSISLPFISMHAAAIAAKAGAK